MIVIYLFILKEYGQFITMTSCHYCFHFTMGNFLARIAMRLVSLHIVRMGTVWIYKHAN